MKAFEEQMRVSDSFPFVLMYREARSAHTEPGFHYHDWLELVYVHSGRGSFLIDRHLYEMVPGDVYLLPGSVIHRAIPNEKEPYVVSVILFPQRLIGTGSTEDAFSYMDLFLPHTERRCRSNRTGRHLLEQTLFELREEMALKKLAYRQRCLTLLQDMLIRVARFREEDTASSGSDEAPRLSSSRVWMSEILSYINDNLREELSLSHLASQALVSPAHFSRVFKSMTGFRLPDYIHLKRVLAAKVLLDRNPDLSVSLVADESGFGSVSYLHRRFKQQFGCTPDQYRRQLPKDRVGGYPLFE